MAGERLCRRLSGVYPNEAMTAWDSFADFSSRRDSDGRKVMTISVRVASVADIDDIVRLNRDVQLLHAQLELSFFKSNFDDEEVASFFAAKFALSENHIRLVPLHSDFDRLTVPWIQCGQVGPIDQDSDTPRHPRAP
jgi:hypothetical protein